MKTRLLLGMIVLLGASPFFLGCSSDDSTDPGAAAAAALVAGNTDLEGKVTVSGGTIILSQNVTLSDTLEIPANVTLAVRGSYTIKAAGGKKLIALDGATVRLDDPDNFDDTGGKLELQYGAALFFGSKSIVGVNLMSGLSWDDSDTNHDSTLSTGGGITGTELAGKLIVNQRATTDIPIDILSGSTLTIKSAAAYTLETSSGRLTVKSGGTLIINGALTGDSTGGAPSIIINNANDVIGSNKSIFYPNDSTAAGAAAAGKTYKWNADAGGSGVAGWKAEA
ncbi:MAG: hypothetical protein LBO80_00290 [Treponema sp.]|jgi:hypothetical protein|nr:hypothetical protein [Treponema sp.]